MPDDNETEGAGRFDREDLIRMLADAAEKTHSRFNAGRFRERPTDQAWMSMGRLLATLATALNGCLRDQEIKELEQRIEALEARK